MPRSGYRRAFTTPEPAFHFPRNGCSTSRNPRSTSRNPCSTSSEIDVPLPPKSVFHFLRNTHPASVTPSAHGYSHGFTSGYRLSRAATRWSARVHPRRALDPSPRHWRQHRDVQHRLRSAPAAAAVSGRGEPRARLGVHGRERRPDALQPIDARARGLRLVRAACRLPGERGRMGKPGGNRHPARRGRLSGAVPPAAGGPAARPAVHRRRGARGCGPGRAAEPPGVDQPLRVGPRHRRDAARPQRRSLHHRRCAR